MKVTHATWELENLGVQTYEFLLDAQDSLDRFAEKERECLDAGAEYLVVKTPVNCARWLFGLPALQYTFVETVFHVAIKRAEYRIPAAIARFDRGLSVAERGNPEDIARVTGIIRDGIFLSDRVSIDPHFTLAQSGYRYANWTRGMLEAGGKLYEMLREKRPVGFFVVCRKDENTVDPVLMGLYDEQNDRGMGALLHKKAMDTCFTWDCKQLQSTIVSNNAKVLRVYVNAGAAIVDTLYTYVKHRGACP
ncbi:MAG: hypothetical protein FWF86_01795 [Clostridia bacterium]|nr:hypothetical protein [Clostridia bacterium]